MEYVWNLPDEEAGNCKYGRVWIILKSLNLYDTILRSGHSPLFFLSSHTLLLFSSCE